ncbi:hypothetical protein GCM10023322_38520 [Rugosimonospora acidiphila]|uniref:non-specific serine/threonine protein kinase n=1 Tax=Rugosimonospora acidiphila TaxID=556531 RepID=A0ABP9RXA2_9ACTN
MLTPEDVLNERYRLDAPIASGGMGEVWRATDISLGRTVALKVMHAGRLPGSDFDARFRAEARTMAALHHPNVVNIYDYGRSAMDDGTSVTYLVMTYVDGESLRDRLADGPLPVAEAMNLVAQAADALHAAHKHGIVHRDVKPANLLVTPDGTVILVDFGVARSDAVTSVTTANAILGTALYMAPEQASGRTVSPATDIYALGAVAFHCLAGNPPFVGETALEIALKHVSDEPPSLPEEVPPAARALVTRALTKDPADRFASAAAFAAAARSAATKPDLVPDDATAVVTPGQATKLRNARVGKPGAGGKAGTGAAGGGAEAGTVLQPVAGFGGPTTAGSRRGRRMGVLTGAGVLVLVAVAGVAVLLNKGEPPPAPPAPQQTFSPAPFIPGAISLSPTPEASRHRAALGRSSPTPADSPTSAPPSKSVPSRSPSPTPTPTATTPSLPPDEPSSAPPSIPESPTDQPSGPPDGENQ